MQSLLKDTNQVNGNPEIDFNFPSSARLVIMQSTMGGLDSESKIGPDLSYSNKGVYSL